MSVLAGLGGGSLGLLLGPFLAGLTLRVPTGGPVTVPGGWRGGAASLARRTTVCLLAAGVLAAVAAALGADAVLPAYLWLGAVGVALAVIDVDCHRLPDRLTLPSYLAGVVLLGTASLAHGDLAALGRALLAMGVVFGGFFALAFASPRSLGLGDVKLAGVLGLFLGWLGWGQVLLGLVAGFVLGAVVAIALLAGRRAGWRSELPFGPALLTGALLAVVAGHQVVEVYLRAAGLR